MDPTGLLWQPLFEAAGQTFVGAIGSYTIAKIRSRYFRKNTFDGAMDLWLRGIHGNSVGEDDAVRIDCFISPYTQLFPGDPLDNARRWNRLHSFPGRISSAEYQSMEFFAGSDAALRTGALNGESLVGLYGRYGFIGEGIVGVASTRRLTAAIPEFFSADFVGARALVKGRLARCPSQHGFVVQSIARKAGIALDWKNYKNIWYIKVDAITVYRGAGESTASLLGSIWAATEAPREQYLVQYGYLSNQLERKTCVEELTKERAWSKARVYCDDIESPRPDLSFKRAFL